MLLTKSDLCKMAQVHCTRGGGNLLSSSSAWRKGMQPLEDHGYVSRSK